MLIEDINNPEVKKIINKARSGILNDRIKNTWDDDYIRECQKEGINELEMLRREVEWIVEDIFIGYGHYLHDDWLEAKKWLKKTDNGKRFTLTNISNIDEEIEVQKQTTRHWKDFINEANRLKRLSNKLNTK